MKTSTKFLTFILLFGFMQTALSQPITTFPWTENFEETDFPPTTTDWHRFQTATGGTGVVPNWQRVTTNATIPGSASAEHPQAGAGRTLKSWLITPALSIPAAGDINLEFDSRVSTVNAARVLSIYYSVGEGIDTTEFSKLTDITGDVTATQAVWTTVRTSLNALRGQTVRLAFVFSGTGNQGTWQIDNVYVGLARGQEVITELPFVENFNSPSVVFPPVGWERARSGAGAANADNQWLRTTAAPASALNPAARQATSTTTGANFSSWLMTPPIAIPAVGSFELDFLSAVSNNNATRYTAVYVIVGGGTDTTSATLLHQLTGDDATQTGWRQITRSLNDFRGQTIRIAFVLRATGTASVGNWNIDDVRVQEARSMEITATTPSYTIVPAFRAIPNPAAIVSSGSFAQTNVALNVNFNGTTIGSTAPIAMNFNTSQILSISPENPVMPVEGTNTIIHTVSADNYTGGDALVKTHTFQATNAGEYAFDNPTATPVLVNIDGDGTAANRVMLGHIFTFTEITLLSQIKFYMGATGGVPQVYVAPINPLTHQLSTAIQSVTAFNGTRVQGWNTHTFANPHVLQPGSYFVAVFNNGAAGDNLPLGRDGVAGKTFFRKTGTALTPAPAPQVSTATDGVPMIRVVVGSPVAAPSNLTVAPARPQTTFTWEGDAPRYIVNVFRNGEQTNTSGTINANTWSVDLPAESTFTWEVIALGGNNVSAQGQQFTVPRDTVRLEPVAIAQGDAINLFAEQNLGNITIVNRGSVALNGEINLSATLEVNGEIVGTEDMTSGATGAWTINGNRNYIFPTLRADLSADGAHEVKITIHNTNVLTGAYVAEPMIFEKTIVNRVLRDSITPTLVRQPYTMIPITQSPINFEARVIVPTSPPSLVAQTNVALNVSFGENVIATSATIDVLQPGVTETLTATPTTAPVLYIGDNVFNFSITSDKLTGNNAVTATQTVRGTLNTFAVDNPDNIGTANGTTNASNTITAGHIFHITERTVLSGIQVRWGAGTAGTAQIQLIEVNGLVPVGSPIINNVNFVGRAANTLTTHTLAEPVVLEPGSYFLGILNGATGTFNISHDQTAGTFYTRNTGNLTAVNVAGGSGANAGMPRIRMIFEIPEYSVNISQTTGGTITVKVEDDKVMDGEIFNVGTVLTLTAGANEGYEFVQWMDGNKHAERTLRLMRDTVISATFALKTHEITFDANGGEGTMEPQAFTHGIEQALNPNTFKKENNTFAGWAISATGEVVYEDEEKISVTESVTLFAVWNPIVHYITLYALPSTGGSVSGGGEHNQGVEITVIATVKAGYDFVSWTEIIDTELVVVSEKTEYTFEVNAPRTLTANFEQKPATFIVTITEPTNGTINVTDEEGNEIADTEFEVEEGTGLIFTAIPNNGYKFGEWGDGNTENPRNIVITENITISAVFEKNNDVSTPIIEKSTVTVFPNPVQDLLHIKAEEAIRQVFVMDLNGRTVKQLSGHYKHYTTIDLRNISAGTYIVRVYTDNAVIPIRIVKQ